MANGFQMFAALLMVQLFYAFTVTLMVPILPGALQMQVVQFTNEDGLIDYTTLNSEVEGTVENQTNIPLLDFGALVFYSSSFLLNLMINFITAVPQMMIMFISAIDTLLSIGALTIQIKAFFTIILSLFYFLGLLSFITGFRSGGGNFA